MCEPDVAVPLLIDAVKARPRRVAQGRSQAGERRGGLHSSARARVQRAHRRHGRMPSKLPLGWNGAYRHFRHPMDYLGADGGGGVGAGPGLTVGAALALKGSRRVVVGIMGDGDYLMGVTALDGDALQAAVPDDRRQQPVVLQRRAAPGARRASAGGRWRTSGSGSASTSPTSILRPWRARRAPSASGPSSSLPSLETSLEQAIREVQKGAVCVVDVRVVPGYDAPMSGAPAAARR